MSLEENPKLQISIQPSGHTWLQPYEPLKKDVVQTADPWKLWGDKHVLL